MTTMTWFRANSRVYAMVGSLGMLDMVSGFMYWTLLYESTYIQCLTENQSLKQTLIGRVKEPETPVYKRKNYRPAAS